ncbi:hypothetical protein B566_EDAN003595 [Ephemera danica]|nr:hypothetical protein B566_EDAN003595 [Ephemera danica]
MDVAEEDDLGCRLVSVKLLSRVKDASSTLDVGYRRNRVRTSKRRGIRASSMPRIMQSNQRHLDRGGDLVEEAALQPPGGGSSTSGNGGGALHNLARSLKQHLRGFSDRLEDTRERLEDTSRCFYLLDKAYEWALEAKKYASRTETAGTEQSVQALKQLQHYLMAHPAPCESHFTEMAQLARKLGNDKLAEQCKTAHARCQETMEVIRTQRARLASGTCNNDTCTSLLPNASSTPLSSSRRRSLPAPPSSCAPYSAGHTCGCWEPATTRPLSLGDIQEVRESAESLDKTEQECDSPWCGGAKARLRRSCTWQHPTESFEEEEEEEETCDRLRGGEDFSVASGSHSAAGDSEDQTDTDPKSVSEESKSPVPPVPVNSHLYHHPSSLELPLSLDQTGDPQHLKTQKTLLLIMREMIQTERDYVRSLEYVIENFIPELLREDIPQAMRGQRNVVFGNIEKIYEFHSQFFLQELEKCETRPLAVGQCFLRHENKFYLYALYNKNKPKSDSLMSEYGTSFFRKKQLELGDRMDLASYLLKPVQRMGKYALLLQQLVKAQGEQGEAAHVADLKAAEAMVRFQLRHGNDLLAMDSLRDCDINVKEQGRLLRQNEFLVWQGKGKKCLRHVFLFEELILFSKARRFPDRKNLDLYIYKHSMKMTDIGLTALVADSSTKFEIWFRKRKPNDTFVLQTMSEDVKQAWTEEISKLLWKQALRNREMRMVEMSSMGIGNKPCLDIRPSADQISDRSISISQLSKTAPRFRNSVVLGSGEHQIRSRRPHSIISVGSTASSSSASGGSGGSSGGSSCHSNYGTLNLDESTHPALLHHRSGTLHSQCSIEIINIQQF